MRLTAPQTRSATGPLAFGGSEITRWAFHPLERCRNELSKNPRNHQAMVVPSPSCPLRPSSMVRNGKSIKNQLRVRRVVDVPLREVSGICLGRSDNGRMFLIAVGDRAAKIAWFSLSGSEDVRINWHTRSIAKLSGSKLPKHNPQIEAVCADGGRRILLLQETPPRVELIDPNALKVVASIDLAVEGRDKIARAWSNPKGSRGEGAVLLPGGHLLVAKEKKPAALIEFGPPHSQSRGLVRGGALADGERWPIHKGHHRFVALAIWRPDKALAKTCADFSDLEIGHDGCLYLLSDKSSTIARLDDLPAGGGTATLLEAWRLGDLDGKPEGLAFTALGRAVVGLDTRKARRNLVLLDPAIAQLRGGDQREPEVKQSNSEAQAGSKPGDLPAAVQ